MKEEEKNPHDSESKQCQIKIPRYYIVDNAFFSFNKVQFNT